MYHRIGMCLLIPPYGEHIHILEPTPQFNNGGIQYYELRTKYCMYTLRQTQRRS